MNTNFGRIIWQTLRCKLSSVDNWRTLAFVCGSYTTVHLVSHNPLAIGCELDHSIEFNNSVFAKSHTDLQHMPQGRIQDLIGGGPDRDRPKLPTVCSSIMRAKQAIFSVGSGACLRALEVLGYFITKYAFSPF